MIKLLMIDDNPMEHFIAKALFKHYGFFENSIHLTGGREAIEYVENNLHIGQNLPDIIFLDLDMPHFSGRDFLEYFPLLLKKLKKTITVYIFSSSVSPLDHQLSDQYPFIKSILIKPLNYSVLQQINENAAS